ncbi:TPA_exp: Uncharacterized protein A8136_6005 [Trichophyton benhamiae CBS 112371]|nr:TPA_exp: Uncharacterized protein A8136_6005 [Trichophyton benhamiae CBS 112371]
MQEWLDRGMVSRTQVVYHGLEWCHFGAIFQSAPNRPGTAPDISYGRFGAHRWYHGPKWYHFLVPFFRVPRIGPGPLQACSTDDLEPIGVDLAAAGPRVPRIGPGPLQACSTDDLEPIGVDLAAAGPRVPRIGPGPLQACSTDDLEPIGVDLAAAGPRYREPEMVPRAQTVP